MLCEGALQVTKLTTARKSEGIFWQGSYFDFDSEPLFIFRITLKCLMSKSLAQGKLIMLKKHFKMLISLIWLSFACPIECQGIINLLVGKFGLLKI